MNDVAGFGVQLELTCRSLSNAGSMLEDLAGFNQHTQRFSSYPDSNRLEPSSKPRLWKGAGDDR